MSFRLCGLFKGTKHCLPRYRPVDVVCLPVGWAFSLASIAENSLFLNSNDKLEAYPTVRVETGRKCVAADAVGCGWRMTRNPSRVNSGSGRERRLAAGGHPEFVKGRGHAAISAASQPSLLRLCRPRCRCPPRHELRFFPDILDCPDDWRICKFHDCLSDQRQRQV